MGSWEERRYREMGRDNDTRDPDETDLGRIVHSAAFRRLQGKTQILGLGDSDFYRTRLTHSIEVAQVAGGITRHLKAKKKCEGLLPSVSLISSISLVHDIGHPPFGHGGEVALNYMMYENNGFEGNAQTLRILTKLDAGCKNGGLNLTRRTLLGTLKYPVKCSDIQKNDKEKDGNHISVVSGHWKPAKGYYDTEIEVVDWILSPFSKPDIKKFTTPVNEKSKFKAFDTSIMDLADDISYGVHDFEDAIHMGFITREDFDGLIEDLDKKGISNWLQEKKITENFVDHLFAKSSGEKWKIKKAIGSLINLFITSAIVKIDDSFEHEFLSHNIKLDRSANVFLDGLKKLVVTKVIKSPQVQTLEYRGQQLIMDLFEGLNSDPKRLLPKDTQSTYEEADEENKKRVIADHLSGMTDEYATKMYERLFVPRQGSVFSKI